MTSQLGIPGGRTVLSTKKTIHTQHTEGTKRLGEAGITRLLIIYIGRLLSDAIALFSRPRCVVVILAPISFRIHPFGHRVHYVWNINFLVDREFEFTVDDLWRYAGGTVPFSRRSSCSFTRSAAEALGTFHWCRTTCKYQYRLTF